MLLFNIQIEDEEEVCHTSQELNAKVTRLQSTLQRISAPNMKALEKLVTLEQWHKFSIPRISDVCVIYFVCL